MSVLTDDALTRLLDEAAAGFAVPDDGPASVLAQLEEPPLRAPLHRRRPVRLLAAAAVVAGAFAGGALLPGDGAAPPSGSAVTQQAAPAPSNAPAADELQVAGDSGRPSDLVGAAAGRSDSGAAESAGALSSYAQTPVGASAPAAAPGVQAPAPDGARIVKNGSIALIVGDGAVTPTLTEVQRLATSVGGIVSAAETQESGTTPSGKVVLRVPVGRFEEVVARVRSLDADVRTATTSGRDVTAEYTDLEAQLRTLRAARERFLEILGSARTISDVLTVQQRVDDVTGQIDRLEGQRALLQTQSDSATLEVTVTEADDPVVSGTDRPDDGLSKAFKDAWEGFTSGVEAIVAASGRVVLVLLVLALAVVLGRLGWRASRRRLV